ncbi:MAG: hypothetical protein MJZ99_11470 [Bacteroidales bacterium]|nr:hypothetical protein [Bacteroidales bacterium]
MKESRLTKRKTKEEDLIEELDENIVYFPEVRETVITETTYVPIFREIIEEYLPAYYRKK